MTSTYSKSSISPEFNPVLQKFHEMICDIGMIFWLIVIRVLLIVLL